MAERENRCATAQRKAEALSDPSGMDGWEGPNISIDGLELDEYIEREIARRVSQPPKTPLKNWVREALQLDPQRPRERIAAYARRLFSAATRAGFRTTVESIEARIHEARRDERREKNERRKNDRM
jgi:transposase